MAAPYFCILPSDWPKWTYSSIQVQLHDHDSGVVSPVSTIEHRSERQVIDFKAGNLLETGFRDLILYRVNYCGWQYDPSGGDIT